MQPETRIVNARTHNLRGVDLNIPHNRLTVITGVSGSGKSSLAIDTLFAEGQRQYIESLSTYARQFLNQLPRPDVDIIEGLQPTLCIDQQTGSTNPRSTVATVTEIYDYLRLLMARVGTPNCFECGAAIIQRSPTQISQELSKCDERSKLILMSPVVRGRKGNHRSEIEEIRKAGLVRVRVNGDTYDLEDIPDLAPRRNHTIEAIVDKIIIRPGCEERLNESVQLAIRLSGGLVTASVLRPDEDEWQDQLFSTQYSCAKCGSSFEELEPRTFSFNSPHGACPTCDGVGIQTRVDPAHLEIDYQLSPKAGAFPWLGNLDREAKIQCKSAIQAALKQLDHSWSESFASVRGKQKKKIVQAIVSTLDTALAQIEPSMTPQDRETWKSLTRLLPCQDCGGGRLRPEALAVRLQGKNIFELCSLSVAAVATWFEELTTADLSEEQATVARPIVTAIRHRLNFLQQVGLSYLTLARAADTLSGGELQRVRLATSIGSGLVGVAYILDEPSIGLHPRDNDRLIRSIQELREQGNTIVVVEHDEAMMHAADLLVDVGPGAGHSGGQIVASGAPKVVAATQASTTAQFLRKERQIRRVTPLRAPRRKKEIRLKKAQLNNLKNVDLVLPLGLLVGVSGVSGSGKSSLVSGTLVPALYNALGQAKRVAGPFKSISGFDELGRLIEIDQSPIGRSPRSTPATYCGVYDLIRKLYTQSRVSKQRGYDASRFSFNTGDGRCPQCQGQGHEKIEMNFLPDMFVRCSLCNGSRFNRQTLQVRFLDKTIADVLQMSVDESVEFFANFSKIQRYVASLQKVGLGYIRLGQSSNTLSGGEAQRVKLATELAKASTEPTIYFLDEPTTGLHFADVQRLVDVLDGLVEQGNSVVVIEHNVDVLRNCDWLIDLGPEGGERGGQIVSQGTPRSVADCSDSLTGPFLRESDLID